MRSWACWERRSGDRKSGVKSWRIRTSQSYVLYGNRTSVVRTADCDMKYSRCCAFAAGCGLQFHSKYGGGSGTNRLLWSANPALPSCKRAPKKIQSSPLPTFQTPRHPPYRTRRSAAAYDATITPCPTPTIIVAQTAVLRISSSSTRRLSQMNCSNVAVAWSCTGSRTNRMESRNGWCLFRSDERLLDQNRRHSNGRMILHFLDELVAPVDSRFGV